MSAFTIGNSLNAGGRGAGNSVYAAGIPFLNNNGLKSTQEKMQRMQEAQSQVDFYEQQKENLKNKECESVEEIAQKLQQLHDYEDAIAAVKKSYNNQQMMHVLDEAIEQGEKMAEAVKDQEPKTPEERAEEARKEALGIEDEGALSEAMEEMLETVENLEEQLPEGLEEQLPESLEGQLPENLEEQLSKELLEQAAEVTGTEAVQAEELLQKYKPFDMRI